VCKVEAIHTTLRKHLAKEEAQLLPLLLHHFSYPEQAELVAQFLYCIPLDTVERVVSWLQPAVPPEELQQLLGHLREVVPDNLLLQLLVTWLNPGGRGDGGDAAGGAAAACAPPGTGGAAEPGAPGVDGAAEAGRAAADGAAPWPPLQVGGRLGGRQAVCAGTLGSCRPPLTLAIQTPVHPQPPPTLPCLSCEQQGIFLFHASIKGALEAFVAEAAALQAARGGVSAAQLAGLVERHRFLRSVCAFHTYSEEEVCGAVAHAL
jgi:zinc finger-like protein